MLAISPQYIVDDNSEQKAVVIQVEEWEKIVEKLEELDDIEAYDKAKKLNDETIPFKQAIEEIEQEKVS